MDEIKTEQILERSPLEGVEIWKNPKNKFVVFQLHYRANPSKRSEDFKDAVRSNMPRAQYLQEYELQWDSFAGLPVYPDFDLKRHAPIKKPTAEIGLPLLRGWDFGLTPACVVGQLQGETLVILKEFVEINMGADRFSDLVLKECAVLWPEWADKRHDWIDCIDPSGEARKDTDEGTCAKILDSKGLRPFPGPVAFEERRRAVEHFLVRQTRKGVAFSVWTPDCPVLTRGFTGGYRYPEKSLEIEPNKIRPVKDEHSHPHDALQYLASRIIMLTKVSRVKIPPPNYGWNRKV